MTEILALIFLTCMLGAAARAEIGVSEQEIVIGLTGDQSASISDIGSGMAHGAQAYFTKVNASGGINGRKIRFIAKDDGYIPAKAVENTKELINDDKIFALLGGAGTPVAQAIMPQVIEKQIPFLFTFSGGSILYPNPPQPFLFALPISYSSEAERLVQFTINQLGIKDIGIVYQDDAYGIAGKAGVEKTLAEFKLKANGVGTYTRNSSDISNAVAIIKKANPKAVYLQAVYQPAIDFVQQCLDVGYSPVFLMPSAVGSLKAQKALVKRKANIYFSEVVPAPDDHRLALLQSYREDMAAAGMKELNFFSVQGYIGARIFAKAVKDLGPDVTRKRLSETLEMMKDYDLDGLKISFSHDKHFGLDSNFLFHLADGKLLLTE